LCFRTAFSRFLIHSSNVGVTVEERIVFIPL